MIYKRNRLVVAAISRRVKRRWVSLQSGITIGRFECDEEAIPRPARRQRQPKRRHRVRPIADGPRHSAMLGLNSPIRPASIQGAAREIILRCPAWPRWEGCETRL